MNTKLFVRVYKTTDLKYKQGFVHCSCGWHKHLGNGFNGYYIESCPNCDSTISVRHQTKLVTGKPGNYLIEEGIFSYFALDNGIHVQISKQVYNSYTRQRMSK